MPGFKTPCPYPKGKATRQGTPTLAYMSTCCNPSISIIRLEKDSKGRQWRFVCQTPAADCRSRSQFKSVTAHATACLHRDIYNHSISIAPSACVFSQRPPHHLRRLDLTIFGRNISTSSNIALLVASFIPSPSSRREFYSAAILPQLNHRNHPAAST